MGGHRETCSGQKLLESPLLFLKSRILSLQMELSSVCPCASLSPVLLVNPVLNPVPPRFVIFESGWLMPNSLSEIVH